MRYEANNGWRYRVAAGAPLTAALLTATLFAPATVARARTPQAAAAQSEYQVTGTVSQNGRTARFRAAFRGDKIQAIHEVIDYPKGGSSDNDYTFNENERLVRFEGNRPSQEAGQSGVRVKETITWDASGKVTSSSRTVGGKPRAFPEDVIGAIRDHGDKMHGEAERVRREKGLPSTPAPAPRPAGNSQTPQVTGHWTPNGMNADFTANFRGDGIVQIREVIHNPKGGDSINNYAFDQNDRLVRFEGNRPSQEAGQSGQRINETIEWNDSGRVTSSRRVAAGKQQSIPSNVLSVIRDHGNKLHGEVMHLRSQQMAQKK